MRLSSDQDISSRLADLEKKIDGVATDVSMLRRHFFWQRVWSSVRTLFLVVTIVAGAAYTIPIMRSTYVQTQDLLKQAQHLIGPIR